MSEYGFTKKDWALFREKLADWQEAYERKSTFYCKIKSPIHSEQSIYR